MSRTKVYIFWFVVFCVVLGLLVRIFQEELGLETKKINLTAAIPKRKFDKSESIYNDYSVSSTSAGKSVYYTKISDVVCDAAPKNDGTKTYFRISMTFESSDKKNAEKISAGAKTIIEDLRDTVANVRMGNTNQAKLMDYIKSNLNRKIKQKFGQDAVSNIYFEEIISQ